MRSFILSETQLNEIISISINHGFGRAQDQIPYMFELVGAETFVEYMEKQEPELMGMIFSEEEKDWVHENKPGFIIIEHGKHEN